MKKTVSKAALIVTAAAVTTLLAATDGEAVSMKTYQLRLTGDDGARFTGECTLSTDDGETVIPMDGQVPYEDDLVGNGLKCKLKTDGKVVVDIAHGGSRSRSATTSGTVNISLN